MKKLKRLNLMKNRRNKLKKSNKNNLHTTDKETNYQIVLTYHLIIQFL